MYLHTDMNPFLWVRGSVFMQVMDVVGTKFNFITTVLSVTNNHKLTISFPKSHSYRVLTLCGTSCDNPY